MRKVMELSLALALAAGCGRGGVGGVMKDYADSVCACKTTACLQEVQTKFQEQLSKLSGREATPGNQQELASAASDMQRAGECSRKLMMDAVPK